MHVVIAGLYGCTIWFAVLALAVIARGDWLLVVWLGPFIVSGSMAFLWAADYLVWRTWAAVARLWRRPARPE